VANKKTARARTKRPAPKPTTKESAAPTPDQATHTQDQSAPAAAMVAPLDKNVFQLVMQIIDNADFKGSQINRVLAVKLELARVAGLRQTGNGQ